MQTFASPNAAAEKKASGSLILGGVSITHPDRVISEIGHITKGELAEYYAGVASLNSSRWERLNFTRGVRQWMLLIIPIE